jgi:hypothetical protein
VKRVISSLTVSLIAVMLLAAVAQAKDIAVYVESGGCSIADSEKIISEALIKGAPNVTEELNRAYTDRDNVSHQVTEKRASPQDGTFERYPRKGDI